MFASFALRIFSLKERVKFLIEILFESESSIKDFSFEEIFFVPKL